MTSTGSSSVQVTTAWKGWRRVPQRPNRLAGVYLWYLEQVCEKSGHYGACVLFNCRTAPGMGWWRRVVAWAWDASADYRYERFDPSGDA